MKRFSHTLALLLTLLTFAPASHAKNDAHAKDRAFITKAYADIDKAFESKSADGATAYLSNDWTSVDDKGNKSANAKTKYHDAMKDALAMATHVASHTTVQSIVFTKTGATVTYAAGLTLTIVVQGTSHTSANTSVERDTWVKSGGTWQVKETTEIKHHVALDGQPDE